MFLCVDAESTCDRGGNAVTDTTGSFLVAPRQLIADKKYILVIRPIGGSDARKALGSAQDISKIREPILIELRGEAYRRFDENTHVLNMHPVNAKTSVFFATDRSVSIVNSEVTILNTNASDNKLTYGRCDVAVVTNGIYDRIINYIPSTGHNDLYYSVQNIGLFSESNLLMNIGRYLNNDSKHDALLFIHGFKTSFDDACRRAAQIAYETKFQGPVLLYSWPSRNSLRDYGADAEMTEWTMGHFMSFLKDVLGIPGLHHVHIIAHSMGNRVLVRGLFSGGFTQEQEEHFGQIVLAAPDVSRVIFDQLKLGRLKKERITLYASDHDLALESSGTIIQLDRIGDAHPEMYVKDGMDSIDASDVDTSLIGHSYFSESRPVLADLATLILSNLEPEKRFGITKEGQSPKRWWYLEPY